MHDLNPDLPTTNFYQTEPNGWRTATSSPAKSRLMMVQTPAGGCTTIFTKKGQKDNSKRATMSTMHH